MRKSGLGLTLLALLSACGTGTHGELPRGGIAGLDGTYRGEATLSLGRTNCPREMPYVLTVRNGMAYGEIFSPRDPKVLAGRFEGLIDAEGRIGTKTRVVGDETLVEGYFDLDRFYGTSKSDNCTNRMTLRRVGA